MPHLAHRALQHQVLRVLPLEHGQIQENPRMELLQFESAHYLHVKSVGQVLVLPLLVNVFDLFANGVLVGLKQLQDELSLFLAEIDVLEVDFKLAVQDIELGEGSHESNANFLDLFNFCNFEDVLSGWTYF